MIISEARDLARKVWQKLDYQEIKDSPTIPYYTKWNYYDKYNVEVYDKPDKPRLGDCYEIDLWDNAKDYENGIVITSKGNVILFNPIENRIIAKNFAFLVLSRGIYIPKDTALETTIGLEYGAMNEGFSGHHLSIIVGENAKARFAIIEKNYGKSAVTTTMEIIVGERAELTLDHVFASSTPSASIIRILQGRNSKLVFRGLYLGGLMHRQQLDITMKEDFSEADIRIGVYGIKKTSIDAVTNIRIYGLSNKANYMGIGITEDNSYVSLRANAILEKHSKASIVDIDGTIYNLGKGATAIVSPVLDIKTNNVKKAKHSKAIIRLSDELLFYLASRGLSYDDIKELLKNELLLGIAKINKKCLKKIIYTTS